MSTPEGAVLRACLDWLALKGIAAWRINVQGVPIHGTPGKFRPAPSKGIADIIAVDDGQAIAVEVKSKVGRQSPAQLAFQQKWEAAGGMYIIARSAADLRSALEA